MIRWESKIKMHYPFRALNTVYLPTLKKNGTKVWLLQNIHGKKKHNLQSFGRKIVYKEGRWYKTLERTWCSLDNPLARNYPSEGSITFSLPVWRPLEEFWDHNSKVVSDIVSRDFIRDVFLSRRDVGRINFFETEDRLKKKLQARWEE